MEITLYVLIYVKIIEVIIFFLVIYMFKLLIQFTFISGKELAQLVRLTQLQLFLKKLNGTLL